MYILKTQLVQKSRKETLWEDIFSRSQGITGLQFPLLWHVDSYSTSAESFCETESVCNY